MFLHSLKFMSLICLASSALAQPLTIIASITPLGLMARSVAGDLAKIDILLDKGQSPHDFVMAMSDRRQLSEADLILWVGPKMEPYLQSLVLEAEKSIAMESLTSHQTQNLSLNSEHTVETASDHYHHGQEGHLWLNPSIGASMVEAIGNYLAAADPENAMIYQQRASRLSEELMSLPAATAKVTERKYVVAHDAYEGFVEAFGYPAPLVASASPELGPSVRSLWTIGEQLQPDDCLLADKTHKRKWMHGFAQKHRLRLVEVDIMGAGETIDSYPQLLRNLQTIFDSCLN